MTGCGSNDVVLVDLTTLAVTPLVAPGAGGLGVAEGPRVWSGSTLLVASANANAVIYYDSAGRPTGVRARGVTRPPSTPASPSRPTVSAADRQLHSTTRWSSTTPRRARCCAASEPSAASSRRTWSTDRMAASSSPASATTASTASTPSTGAVARASCSAARGVCSRRAASASDPTAISTCRARAARSSVQRRDGRIPRRLHRRVRQRRRPRRSLRPRVPRRASSTWPRSSRSR